MSEVCISSVEIVVGQVRSVVGRVEIVVGRVESVVGRVESVGGQVRRVGGQVRRVGEAWEGTEPGLQPGGAVIEIVGTTINTNLQQFIDGSELKNEVKA